ncbi:MAG: hypothetical protein ACOYL8_03685 [Patescibacteria group bacterium]
MSQNEKNVSEKNEGQDQAINNQSVKPMKKYNAGDLIGAQVKTPYQNKMDGDSFLIT